MLFFGLPVRIYTPLYLSRHRGILSLATLNIFISERVALPLIYMSRFVTLLEGQI